MVDALQPGIQGFRLVVDRPQLLDRFIAKVHGRSQRGEVPHVHAVHVADKESGRHGDGADEFNQRRQQALPPDRTDGSLDVTVNPVPEQTCLLLFQFKGPDVPLGGKVFLKRGGKIPLAGLHHASAGEHFLADVADGNHADAHQEHVRQQNKELLADGGPVNQESQRGQEGQGLDNQVIGNLHQAALQELRVLHQAAQQVSLLLAIMKGQG